MKTNIIKPVMNESLLDYVKRTAKFIDESEPGSFDCVFSDILFTVHKCDMVEYTFIEIMMQYLKAASFKHKDFLNSKDYEELEELATNKDISIEDRHNKLNLMMDNIPFNKANDDNIACSLLWIREYIKCEKIVTKEDMHRLLELLKSYEFGVKIYDDTVKKLFDSYDIYECIIGELIYQLESDYPPDNYIDILINNWILKFYM